MWLAARAFSSSFSLSSTSYAPMSAALEVSVGAAESSVAFESDEPNDGSVPQWGARETATAAVLGGGERRAAGDADGGEA